MSWEAIVSYKAITQMRESVALQAVWGVLELFTVSKTVAIEDIGLWILKRANELSDTTCLLTEAHIDGFAALQAGDGIHMPQMTPLGSWKMQQQCVYGWRR